MSNPQRPGGPPGHPPPGGPGQPQPSSTLPGQPAAPAQPPQQPAAPAPPAQPHGRQLPAPFPHQHQQQNAMWPPPASPFAKQPPKPAPTTLPGSGQAPPPQQPARSPQAAVPPSGPQRPAGTTQPPPIARRSDGSQPQPPVAQPPIAQPPVAQPPAARSDSSSSQPVSPFANPWQQQGQRPQPAPVQAPPMQAPPPPMQPAPMQPAPLGQPIAPPPMQPAPMAHAPLPPAWSPAQHQPLQTTAAALFQRSLGRALRLRIEPSEVKPTEALALDAAGIADPNLMAFLAWRRALLVLVGCGLVPLTLLRFIDAFKDDGLSSLRFLILFPALAEAALCGVCIYQLRNWTNWVKQRRVLFRAWLIYMVVPFVVFLIPTEGIANDIARQNLPAGAPDAAVAAGAIGIKAAVAAYALLELAPRAVSLLAGTVRAGIVTKMLFPGSAGPGWLVVLAAPIYTLFAFTLLIVPYQVTSSGWFVAAMLAITGAQFTLGRAGFQLAKPMTHMEAVATVNKARKMYLIAMGIFALCIIIALGSHAKEIGVARIFTTILSFEVNVMLLTLIGSDLVIANLDRARGVSAGTAHLADETNQKLASFVNNARGS